MIDWKQEWKKLAGIVAVLAVFFWLPMDWERFTGGIMEALHLARWYAREHVLLCLVPAFFIAGAIGVFVSQASVMKYLGAKANKVLAYGVASVSGTILAVCSCTVLPLFAGIYRMGAGLGPATAFLYSGPAINVLAIILTARILGLKLGIARAIGAIAFSVIIGLAMHFIYRNEELNKASEQLATPDPEVSRPLWRNAGFFFVMIGVLVFSNWGAPNDFRFRLNDGREFRATVTRSPEDASAEGAVFRVKMLEGPDEDSEIDIAASEIADKTPLPGVWTTIWESKWLIASAFAIALALVLVFWFGVAWWKVALAAIPPTALALVLPSGELWVLIPFSAGTVALSVVLSTDKGEGGEWFAQTWGFAKQILPLLLIGVMVAGFLLGRPDHEGLIPGKYVEMLVGDNPDTFFAITGWGGGAFEDLARSVWALWTNFFASVFGAFMYFATLTEVPILQGLIASGMGKGPALALLLAGPALSLPNMLVIASVLGARKTITFVSLVVVMATISGMIYGAWFQDLPTKEQAMSDCCGSNRNQEAESSSCCGASNGRTVLLYACSGAANVAEISDRAARELMFAGEGTMFCLAGLGADIQGMIRTAGDADLNLLIDGCPLDCAKKTFDRCGLTNYKQIKVTDLGIEKVKGVRCTDEQVDKVVAKAKETLAEV